MAARWLLPDEATPYTDAIFDLLKVQDAIVPALFLSEFSNVFLKLSRQRKLTSALALSAVQRLSTLGLEVDRHTPDSVRLFTLAANMACRLMMRLTLSLRYGAACPRVAGMAA